MPARLSNAKSQSSPSSLQGMELAIPSFRDFVDRTPPIDCQKPLPPLPLQPRKKLGSSWESTLPSSKSEISADVTYRQAPSRSTSKQGLSRKAVAADTSNPFVPTTSDVECTANDATATTESEGAPYFLKPSVFQPRNDLPSSRPSKATMPISDFRDHRDRSMLAPQAELEPAVGIKGSKAFARRTTHPDASAEGHIPAVENQISPYREALRFCESWRNAMRGTPSRTGSETGTAAPANEHSPQSYEAVSALSSPWCDGEFSDCTMSTASKNQNYEHSHHKGANDAPCDDGQSLTNANSGEVQNASLTHQGIWNEQCLHSSSSRALRGRVREEGWSRHSGNGRSKMQPSCRVRSNDNSDPYEGCDTLESWSDGEQFSDQIPLIVPSPYKTRSSGRFARIVRSATSDRPRGSSQSTASEANYTKQRTWLDSQKTSFDSSQPSEGSTKLHHGDDILPAIALFTLTMNRSKEFDPQRQKRKAMRVDPLPPLPTTSIPSLGSSPMTPTLAFGRSPAAVPSYDADSASSSHSASNRGRATKQAQYGEIVQGPVKRVTVVTRPLDDGFRSRARTSHQATISKPLPPYPSLTPRDTRRASPLSCSSLASNALPLRRSSKKPLPTPTMSHSKSLTGQFDGATDTSNKTASQSLTRRVSDAMWGIRREGKAEREAEKRREELKKAIRLVSPRNTM